MKKLKAIIGAIGLSSYLLAGCGHEKKSDDLNQTLLQMESLELEDSQPEEQIENKTEEQNETILEQENIEDEQENTELNQLNEYKASNLFVVEVDNQCCILECCDYDYQENGVSTFKGLDTKIKGEVFHTYDKIDKIKLYKNKFAIDIDDYTEIHTNVKLQSVFNKEDGSPCCSLLMNQWIETLQNENKNNYISTISDSIYYKTNEATYNYYLNTPNGDIHYQIDDESKAEAAEEHVKWLTEYSSFTEEQPDGTSISWDGDITLTAFTEVFGCNPEDIFTQEELSEMTQELNTEKGYVLHK